MSTAILPSAVCYLHLCYPFPCICRAKLEKNCVSEFPTTPRITSVNYGFPNRKRFPSGAHVQFCPNLCSHFPPRSSPAMHSVLRLPQPVLCVLGPSVTLLKIYCPCRSHERTAELEPCCIPLMGQVVDWQGERFPWESVRGV
jgi:hypothetical protein